MAKFTPRAFGKYFLIDKLAVGGMAEIYKAKTFGVDGFEKQLAIKKILPHCSADKDFINMLVDEAKLSVLLSHANIVQVYDLGKVGDDYFISMEFIDGFNLRQVLHRLADQGQKLSEEIIVYIMSEVCKGLDYAHHRKDNHNNPLSIVHRDVSPQNVLLSFEGEVKIVDFGIAKAAMNMSHTMAGILKGKVSYMSPEQALGKGVDARTDIFSVGAVFYELLTGKKLFSGDTQFEVLKKIRSTRITEAFFGTDISPALKPILAKALAWRPQDRFENAGDLQIELTKHLYTSYRDFSPRQLSGFVKTLFAEELHNRKEKSREEVKALDTKTQTILMSAQEQENIVHRGGSDSLKAPDGIDLTASTNTYIPTDAAGTQTAVPAPVTHGGPTITEHQAARRRHSLRWIIAGILLALALGAGVYIYQVYYKGIEPAKPVAPLAGTLTIVSTPADAQVMLNGKATTLSTPATLTQLDLYIGHKITLRKERYLPWEKIVTLVNNTPLHLDAELEPIPYGSVTVESVPSGATISVNGADSGQQTPATFDTLEVGKSYRFGVSKPLYTSQEKEIAIGDPNPIAWQVELKAIPSEPPPEKLPEKQIEKPIEKPKEKPTPPPAPKESPVEEAPKTVTPGGAPPGEPASISLRSAPSDAVVYVNGIRIGKTPGTFQVSSGTVEIIVEKERLFPYRQTLTLKPGEKKKLAVELSSLTGKVQVSSIPSAATVYFDGDKAGNTPIRVSGVHKGKSYRIDVKYPGFKPWSKTVTLTQDSLEIMANLEKE